MGARRARLCVWPGLTNVLFIDTKMKVATIFCGNWQTRSGAQMQARSETPQR